MLINMKKYILMKFIGKVLILLGCNPNKYHDIKKWFDIDSMVDADMKVQH